MGITGHITAIAEAFVTGGGGGCDGTKAFRASTLVTAVTPKWRGSHYPRHDRQSTGIVLRARG
jgi:hypothetical protein